MKNHYYFILHWQLFGKFCCLRAVRWFMWRDEPLRLEINRSGNVFAAWIGPLRFEISHFPF